LKAVIGALGAAGALALAGCGGDDTEAFCEQAREAEAAGRSLPSAQVRDPEEATEALGEASAQAQEAADVAPDEISADAEQVARFLDEIATQAQEAQSPRDYLGVAQAFQEQVADIQDANNNVEAYVEENCESD